MKLSKQLGFGPGHIELDGVAAPLSPKGTQPPNLAPISVVTTMAGWIKLPFGMEVGLGPGDFVLDGNPAPLSKKGAEPPSFWPMSIVAKRSPISATAAHLYKRSRLDMSLHRTAST